MIPVFNVSVCAGKVNVRLAEKKLALPVLVDSAARRLRPVVMTALTTIGGLLPLLLAGKPSGIWYSLALGTIGGLISSTLLTLVVVPVLYSMALRIKD